MRHTMWPVYAHAIKTVIGGNLDIETLDILPGLLIDEVART